MGRHLPPRRTSPWQGGAGTGGGCVWVQELRTLVLTLAGLGEEVGPSDEGGRRKVGRWVLRC